jgi:Protein of unknown function (DUF692)
VAIERKRGQGRFYLKEKVKEKGPESQHLAFASHNDVFLNDLLPPPFNVETLALVCDHIDQIQAHLQCHMLLENPATYVEFAASTMTETDFIGQVLRRTGCGLLLDVSNIYVSCTVVHQCERILTRTSAFFVQNGKMEFSPTCVSTEHQKLFLRKISQIFVYN